MASGYVNSAWPLDWEDGQGAPPSLPAEITGGRGAFGRGSPASLCFVDAIDSGSGLLGWEVRRSVIAK